MAETDSYTQFSLSQLARRGKERYEAILAEGCIEHAGESALNKLKEDSRERVELVAKEFCGQPETPQDYDPKDEMHLRVVLGAKKIQIRLGSVRNMVRAYTEVRELRHKYLARRGLREDGLVRIKTAWIFDARDGKMREREFDVLCALYSCIGAFQYKWVTKDVLQFRSLGYMSAEAMEKELPGHLKSAVALSLSQIGRTLNALHGRHFFERVRPNKRQTYYSIRVTRQELEEAVFRQKTGNTNFSTQQKRSDLALMERIKAARLAAQSPAAAGAETEEPKF